MYAARNLQPKKGEGKELSNLLQYHLSLSLFSWVLFYLFTFELLFLLEVYVMLPLFLELARINIALNLYATTILRGMKKAQCEYAYMPFFPSNNILTEWMLYLTAQFWFLKRSQNCPHISKMGISSKFTLRVNQWMSESAKIKGIGGNTWKVDLAQTSRFGGVSCPKNRYILGLFKYWLILEKYANNSDLSKTAKLPLNFTPGLMGSNRKIYVYIRSKHS